MADQLTLYQLGELIMPQDFQTFRHPSQVLDTRGYKVQRIREFDLDQIVRFQERVGDGTFLYIEELEEYRQNFTLCSKNRDHRSK